MFHPGIKATMDKNEDGFTLIEILVVILIIGILASIAIPVFLNQRQTANDAAVKSDVRNTAMVIETYFVNNPTATAIDANHVRTAGTKSEGTVMSIHGNKNDFCIVGHHRNGKKYLFGSTWESNNGVRPYYLYNSLSGGEDPTNTGYSVMSCNSYGTSFSWS